MLPKKHLISSALFFLEINNFRNITPKILLAIQFFFEKCSFNNENTFVNSSGSQKENYLKNGEIFVQVLFEEMRGILPKRPS